MVSILSNIAQHAGVSEATVSRVLNSKPGVAPGTRDAVLTAVDILGYVRPQQLRGQRFRIVGIVLPEMRNPIYPAFAEAIGAMLSQRGLTPVVCVSTLSGVPEHEYVEMLLERQAAGIIFICGQHAGTIGEHGHYQHLKTRKLPIVAVNGVAEGLDLPAVSADDAAAVDLAVRHLKSLGHQRIGLITSEEANIPSYRKSAGFRAAMKEHLGMEHSDEWIERTQFTSEGGFAAATRLLSRRATGLVCSSDIMAVGAIRAARRLNLNVPDDVSVIGYDDSPFMPAVDPPITTIRQPIDEMARAIVGVLVDQLGGTPARAEEMYFEPDLILRSSTGPPPVP